MNKLLLNKISRDFLVLWCQNWYCKWNSVHKWVFRFSNFITKILFKVLFWNANHVIDLLTKF